MKIGITGSRDGLTDGQRLRLRIALEEALATELHHGDCIGVDAQAHSIGRELGLYIVGHLPIKSAYRAFCLFDEERVPKEYLERNRAIVDDTEWLLAFPRSKDEELRSGTWATIRYARKCEKGLTIFSGDINGQA